MSDILQIILDIANPTQEDLTKLQLVPTDVVWVNFTTASLFKLRDSLAQSNNVFTELKTLHYKKFLLILNKDRVVDDIDDVTFLMSHAGLVLQVCPADGLFLKVPCGIISADTQAEIFLILFQLLIRTLPATYDQFIVNLLNSQNAFDRLVDEVV